MFARTYLNVTSIRTLPVLFNFLQSVIRTSSAFQAVTWEVNLTCSAQGNPKQEFSLKHTPHPYKQFLSCLEKTEPSNVVPLLGYRNTHTAEFGYLYSVYFILKHQLQDQRSITNYLRNVHWKKRDNTKHVTNGRVTK